MTYESFQAYREAWTSAYHEDPTVPLNVDIELASLCNLACPFCFYGEAEWNEAMKQPAADGKPKKRFMPLEMALRIIDQAAELGVPALKFNWRGESTMHKHYSTILEYAAGKSRYAPGHGHTYGELKCRCIPTPAFHELLVNTNANCKDEAIAGLMRATKVMVSLDSTVPETYAKMRVNGDLDRAIAVVKELVRRGHPNIWVRRVVTKMNQDEPFAQEVRRIFGPAVKISQHACFDRNENDSYMTAYSKCLRPDIGGRSYCGYPSQRIMIASDGTAFPCCVDYDGTMPMGKFPEQSLIEIWNGEPFRKLRGELRADKFTSNACKNCTSWMSYNAPERRMVQDQEIKTP